MKHKVIRQLPNLLSFCKAEALKNLCKETKFDYDTHDCTFNPRCFSDRGWQAKFGGYKVSLAELFQHICLTVFATSGAIW